MTSRAARSVAERDRHRHAVDRRRRARPQHRRAVQGRAAARRRRRAAEPCSTSVVPAWPESRIVAQPAALRDDQLGGLRPQLVAELVQHDGDQVVDVAGAVQRAGEPVQLLDLGVALALLDVRPVGQEQHHRRPPRPARAPTGPAAAAEQLTSAMVVVTATSQTLRSAAGSRRHSPGSSCSAITAVTSTAATTSATNIAAYAASQSRRSRPSPVAPSACGASAWKTSDGDGGLHGEQRDVEGQLAAALAAQQRPGRRRRPAPGRAMTATGSKASSPSTIGISLRLIACPPRRTRRWMAKPSVRAKSSGQHDQPPQAAGQHGRAVPSARERRAPRRPRPRPSGR